MQILRLKTGANDNDRKFLVNYERLLQLLASSKIYIYKIYFVTDVTVVKKEIKTECSETDVGKKSNLKKERKRSSRENRAEVVKKKRLNREGNIFYKI